MCEMIKQDLVLERQFISYDLDLALLSICLLREDIRNKIRNALKVEERLKNSILSTF